MFLMRYLLIVCTFCLINNCFAECSAKQELQKLVDYHWLTEDYPPYNFMDDNGAIVGIFPDTLAEIYQELNIPLKQNSIEVVPWARLYHIMEHDMNSAAFSMVKTPERDRKFMLVALPNRTRVSIMVLEKNYQRFLKTPLSKLTIAVVRDDIGQQLLISQRIEALQKETTSALSMINMLVYGRVDAIAYAEEVTYYQDKKLGFAHDKIVPLLNLDNQSQNSFVFHKQTSQCLKTLFTSAIERLETKGKLAHIWRKYTQ